MADAPSGFLVQKRDDGFGDVFPLVATQRYSIGRSPDNRIVLRDDLCSRYHAEVISTPRHARHTLCYVLNNWRRHKEDRSSATSAWILDPYSSAVSFDGWNERTQWDVPPDYEALPVARPETWLLREGWKRHGTISVFEVPASR